MIVKKEDKPMDYTHHLQTGELPALQQQLLTLFAAIYWENTWKEGPTP